MLFGQKLNSHRIFKRLAKALIRQTACMRRLVLAFAGCTYHIVGNLKWWLNYALDELEGALNECHSKCYNEEQRKITPFYD